MAICPTRIAQAASTEQPLPTPTPSTTIEPASVLDIGKPLPEAEVLTAQNADRLRLLMQYTIDDKYFSDIFWHDGQLWGATANPSSRCDPEEMRAVFNDSWRLCNFLTGECEEFPLDFLEGNLWSWVTLDEKGNFYLAFVRDQEMHVVSTDGEDIIKPFRVNSQLPQAGTFFRLIDRYLVYSLTYGRSGTTYLRNLETGKQWSYPGDLNKLTIGGEHLLIMAGCRYYIIDLSDGAVIYRLKPDKNNYVEGNLILSPDGRMAALENDIRNTIRIIDPYTHREIAEWSVPNKWKKRVFIQDGQKFNILTRLAYPNLFNNDGSVLIIGDGYDLALVSSNDGTILKYLSDDARQYSSTLSPDGRYLTTMTQTSDDIYTIKIYGVPQRFPIRCTDCEIR